MNLGAFMDLMKKKLGEAAEEPKDFGHWHVIIFDKGTGMRHNIHMKDYPKNYAGPDSVEHISKKYGRPKDQLEIEDIRVSHKYDENPWTRHGSPSPSPSQDRLVKKRFTP
jgi:hypothetical protein